MKCELLSTAKFIGFGVLIDKEGDEMKRLLCQLRRVIITESLEFTEKKEFFTRNRLY